MKKILFSSMFVISCLTFGQNVKMKKGIVTIDDKEWAKYEGCGFLDADCSIQKNDGEVAIILHKVNDIASRGKLNKDGEVSWCEVKFLGTNLSYEIIETNKSTVKTLYKTGVFNEDGSFNMEKVNKLVEKYGQQFSKRYYQNNSTQTVIIQDTRPANGVNISVGK
ncbi:hypothetical protein QFZ37_002434 [Chryseobacterium ginsenosidimutans]|uniref:hypothetical protein n=1 Tax=Chryseobacterium ginsenosidimutans TaxID=687846 RepID=UPI0027868FB8|nr:hypothetical protein [Chryseobacterium ginsenosidimutans]MDQ0594065.1 hypothetical protein [Chryseobacterium ginsenosidimutans]